MKKFNVFVKLLYVVSVALIVFVIIRQQKAIDAISETADRSISLNESQGSLTESQVKLILSQQESLQTQNAVILEQTKRIQKLEYRVRKLEFGE